MPVASAINNKIIMQAVAISRRPMYVLMGTFWSPLNITIIALNKLKITTSNSPPTIIFTANIFSSPER